MRHFLLSTAAIAALTVAAPLAASAQSSGQDTSNIDCPGAFAAIDSNADGKVSGKEASAGLQDEFARIDADGDGNISAMEWQTCGMQPRATQMHTMMDAKPSDLQGGDHAPLENSAQGEGTMKTMMDAKAADLQAGDHAPMDSAELNKEEPPRPWWTGDAPFDKADTNDDGTITRAEAANAAEFVYGQKSNGTKSQQSAEQAARESGARFTMLDRDGDGVISEAEWKNRDQADIMSLFARMDQNDDDKLSKSEFQAVKAHKEIADDPVTIWYYYTY